MALIVLRSVPERFEPLLLTSIRRNRSCLQWTRPASNWDDSRKNWLVGDAQNTHRSRIQARCYSTQPVGDGHSQPSKFWKYILGKFNNYVSHYTEKLQKKPIFQRFMDVTRIIKCVKFVAQDTKTYIMVATYIWAGGDLESYSRKELEVYHQMPKDIMKLTPLLLLAAIPFIGNAFFILGYWYPRIFLTHQFWTDEQKRDFFQQDHKKKCGEYRHILTYMDKQVHKHMTGDGREKMLNILKKVENGAEPSIEELLDVKEYFESFPFSVDSLPSPYFRHLVKSCDMSTRRFPLLMYGVLFYIKQRRTPFQEDGYLLLHTDQVMIKEGLDTLTDEEICKACLRRGLNPYGLSKDEQLNYLEKWTKISSKLDENSISLLLHSPVLLTYNSPTNIQLMKGTKYGWKRKT